MPPRTRKDDPKIERIHSALFGDNNNGSLKKLDDLHLAVHGDGNGKKGLVRDMDSLKFYAYKLPAIATGAFACVWWIMNHVQMK